MPFRLVSYVTVLVLVLIGVVPQHGWGQVVINEVMPSNATTRADADGGYPDWIELYNTGSAPISLAGYGLSDDADDPFRWTFPDLTVPAEEFAFVWASGREGAPAPQQWSTVIDAGHQWHYYAATTAPPSVWADPRFDPSNWPTGPSGFGYGDGDDATIVNPAPALAVYTRTTFDVPDPANVVAMRLHVDYDDAYVAYLNGKEVARANIGQAGGSRPSVNTPADSFTEPFGVRGLPLPEVVVEAPAALLVPGENVLAVQVHNYNTSSSDLTLLPILTLGFATPETNRPGLSARLDAAAFATASHASFRLRAAGETIYLTAPGGSLADSLAFPAVPTDVAYGRFPDGGPDLGMMLPTPDAPNTSLTAPPVATPVFDLPGGRFGAPVSVTIQTDTPGASLYYTIDGTTPTLNDLAVGTAPLLVLSTRVLRVRAFRDGALPSPVVSHTFVIGDDTDLPIVALSTEPENLWDQASGIYVRGPNAEGNFPHFGANFWEDWEIPALFELFEPDGTQFEAGAGVKIFGGWSRGFNQKSLSLFARADYGDAAFDYRFFPDRPLDSYQALVLRNSGNDWPETMMRDGALHTIVRDLDIDALAHRPVVLYLNGEYWGIHNLRQKINEHYAADAGSLTPDAIELLEYVNSVGPAALHGTMGAYDDMMAFLTSADLSTPEAYAEIARRLDLNNVIDYYLAQIYFDNRDWPGNNNKFWRPATPEGRFRWILFDTDFGFGIWNASAYQDNTLAFATQANGPNWPNPPWSTLLLRRLLTSPDFVQAFVNRFADLMNGPLATPRVQAVIDSMQANIADEMLRHQARWGGDLGEWQRDVQVMRSFALNRPNAMRNHMRWAFGLRNLSPVAVQVSDPVQGSVTVNRLTPDTYPWSGLYYDGTLVPVTATPQPGYRFAGWTGTTTSTEAAIWVDPEAEPNLTAVFEPGVAPAAQVRINEIQYHPPNDQDTGDWVELVNPSAEAVPLDGWVFQDGDDNHTYAFPPGTTLEAGGYLVVTQDPAAFAAIYPAVPHVGGWTFGLSKSGDLLRLFDAASVVIDSLTYDDDFPWPPEADGDGPTLERLSPTHPSSDPASWRAAAQVGGTPGAANSTSVSQERAPEVPATDELLAPYPNPFHTQTTIGCQLAAPGHLTITVYDALGRRVTRLADRFQAANTPCTVRWNAPDLSPGLYFVRLTVDGVPRASVPVMRM